MRNLSDCDQRPTEKNERAMKTPSKYLGGSSGFSLVELLVVIAVIAIIAAIAIPNIANITSQASVAKNQRNAQNIASVASAARAAGYNTAWGSVDGAVTFLTQSNGAGVAATMGTNTVLFGVSGLSDQDKAGAETYLNYQAPIGGAPDGILYSATAAEANPSTSPN